MSVCVVMATNISVVHAFGTLFPYILLEFGENRANTATIQSVLFGVGLCSGSFFIKTMNKRSFALGPDEFLLLGIQPN